MSQNRPTTTTYDAAESIDDRQNDLAIPRVYNPVNDPNRLKTLYQLGLLDSPREEVFDRVTRLITKLLHVPMAFVSLVDVDRQFFKSQVGLPEPWASSRETPLSHSFCQYVVMQGERLVIEDAHCHPLVHDNKAVTELNVTAYAGIPLTSGDGRVLGSVCMIDTKPRTWTPEELHLLEDLMATLVNEIELRRLTQQLKQQNEDLQTFAQTVAHDLKIPISVILGYANLLSMDLISMSHEQLMDYVVQIERSGNKMVTIIDELLMLAQIGQTEVQLVELDMEAIIAEVQSRLCRMFEHYKPEISLPSVWPKAMGYPGWVEEIWVNYISNALKYGGTPPRIKLGAALQPDGMLRFWVQDNGRGLSPEQQATLFQPFTRIIEDPTRENQEGHGLGLSIVRRIAEKLGGSVQVESTLNTGSTFSFILAAAPASSG